ncbi:MAG: Eco57I restriction-modification methylase domain-containing protein [Nitrospirae bacterium]|nr:Eco57I restriction-modification methylase domain-containing protein [Nitrospirota bacterium]
MLRPDQPGLFFWNNQNLFSNNYLGHHLPATSLWNEQKEKIEDVFDNIKKAYDETRTLKLGPGEEAGLEERFIRPVLKALGYELDPQPTTKRGIKKKRPDYALFKDRASLEDARKDKNDLVRFFKFAVTILEAKYWGRRLNDADPEDTLDKRDPTAQTVKYLDDVYHASEGRIQWAILTNGKQWRLFYYRAASRSGNFFEIDLEDMIRRNDAESFLYFYPFFSRDAFVPDSATGKTWLDQHLKGTEEYAVRVSENLKGLIFDEVFEGLATGFIEYRRNELGIRTETTESLKDVFAGCLTLLYRLLFLLYAESRNLLPSDDRRPYYKKSLRRLKEDICRDIRTTGSEHLSRNAYDYWSRLESLCRIIDKGDKALNIPIYNGGLFETQEGNFLSRHKISDPFVASAVEKLTVEHEVEHSMESTAYIDYSSLSVRHLGDIYEGLLEFHVRIADEEMIEVKEKGKSVWKKAATAPKEGRIISRKQKGELYIENSKHERKATGSYYTPHYIVEYIVKNTVGSVLDEKFKTAEKLLSDLEDARKSLRKQESTSGIQAYRAKIRELEDSIFNTIFDIKVLDPAMGSGHFLVHTVDFISDEIIAFLADYPENPVLRKIGELKKEIIEEIDRQGVKIDESRLTEVNLIKRMVMKRCIYGVDLNEMAVELAKLSLWLDSFTLGAPLSFLDHHLKCGNSLIGTSIEELEKALTGHLFAINLEPLKRAIRDMIFVSDLPDATVGQVRASYKKFGEANRGLEGYRILLDMLVAEHFGIADAKKMLISDFDKIDLNNLQGSISKLPDKDKELIEKTRLITEEKKFFHWEIEFPEVFYEKTSEFGQKIDRKTNSGFDCVIGNPPYVRQEELGTFKKDYLKPTYRVFHNMADIYTYFFERGIESLRNGGHFGMITSNKFMKTNYGLPLRNYLTKRASLRGIVDFGELPVFEDAATFPAIFIIERANDIHASFSVQYAPIRTLSFETLEAEIQKAARVIDSTALKGESWSLVGEDSSSVFAKMRGAGRPLGEYCSGSIKYGVKTGLNEAFVIDRETKDKLIKADARSTEFIKPLIVGDDVRKYEIDYRETYLVVIPSSSTRISMLDEVMEEHGFTLYDKHVLNELQRCIEDKKKWDKKCIEYNLECGKSKIWKQLLDEFRVKVDNAFEWFADHYPAISAHFKKHESAAKKRADKGDFWWELRPCDYYDYFEKPKIVYPEIAMESRFALDETGAYPIKTIFTIPLDDKFLLSVLNSKLSFEYLKNTCSVLGDVDKRGRLLLQLIYLENLPIPRIFFTTPGKERKERVSRAIELYKKGLEQIAIKSDKWQNKSEEQEDDKGRDERGPARPGKVAGKPRGYRIPAEDVSGEDTGLGGEVCGVREGTGEYEAPEGTSGQGEDSTRPLDSARYFETAQGIKTYSEVAEILAVSVTKSIEQIIDGIPGDIHFTPEWICKLHGYIAGSLFPDRAGRFRDVNVQVSSHIPPPYSEVPIHMRLYCDDLMARMTAVSSVPDIERKSETLAYADWRFQWIHPFKDFNGRVGRILLTALLFKLRLPPADTASVDPAGIGQYLRSLHEADAGDLSLLTGIWLERLSGEAKENGEK